MRRPVFTSAGSFRPLPPGAGRGEAAPRGFSLVELLVVIMIVLMLMALMAGALSAARGSQKKQATQMLIAKLDVIIQQQYSTYASRNVVSATSSALRAAAIRRTISGDLPDSWEDIRLLASRTAKVLQSGTDTFPNSSPQRSYVAIWDALPPTRKDSTLPTYVGAKFGDAECLFMIVMQGGIANCIDCSELRTAKRGDIDGDGAFEFLDAWGYPIRFVLWPAGLQLPAGSGIQFFSSAAPFAGSSQGAIPGRVMRPLLFSCGPDETNLPPEAAQLPSFITSLSTGNLSFGTNCGVPPAALSSAYGAPSNASSQELPVDNITNFDAEAMK